MELYFHQVRETFHLMNDKISYIMKVLSNGMLAQMYFGKGIADRPLFDYLLELSYTIFHDEPALSRSARIPSPVPHPTGAWCLARPSPTDFTQPLVGYRFRVYRGQSAQDRAHRAVYRREIVRT